MMINRYKTPLLASAQRTYRKVVVHYPGQQSASASRAGQLARAERAAFASREALDNERVQVMNEHGWGPATHAMSVLLSALGSPRFVYRQPYTFSKPANCAAYMYYMYYM
jgi:hypothetical protein